MRFSVFSKIRSFFQSFFKRRRPAGQEATYSQQSFISHLSGQQLSGLTEEGHSVLTSSPNELPDIIIYRFGSVVPDRVTQLLSESAGGVHEKYINHINDARVVDGALFKLSNVKTQQVHFLRRMDGEAEFVFKKTDKVQRLLGPYALKFYHHRCINETYVSEVEYIEGLRHVKDDLALISDPIKKAERLLSLAQKMLSMIAYFQEKQLYWSDVKPENFYIRPDTDELCAADTKNMFTHKNTYLPRYAFTPDYTAPSILDEDKDRKKNGRQGKVSLSEYKDQLHFSFLKTLQTLLDACDQEQAPAKRVAEYLRLAQQSLSIFTPKVALYPERPPKKLSQTLPAYQQSPRLRRRSSKTNLHAGLEFSTVGLFKDAPLAQDLHNLVSADFSAVTPKRSLLSRLLRRK